MPRFSLVIPTLRRADTLEHALATLCSQSYADLEIVVQNNGGDDATRRVVEAADDVRVRHFASDDVLPMTENWEAALSHCEGDFVTFIGDDDGLLPDACSIAADVLGPDDEILSWEPLLYYWPGFFDESSRNTLMAAIEYEPVIRSLQARPLLKKFYAFDTHYAKLPMIYNSFVGRSLIDRIQARLGRYFVGSCPDVTSGIVNASACDSFLKSSRALSVAGLSHHSLGQRITQSGEPHSDDEVARDFPLLAQSGQLASPLNLELCIAADMGLAKDAVLAEDADIELRPRGLIQSVAAAINNNPSRYEATLAAIGTLIERFEIDPETVWIPPNTGRPPLPAYGVHVLGPHELLFVVDGEKVGLRSIDDAVRLASQLLPAEGTILREDGASDFEPLALTGAPVSLAKGGDGTRGLVSGWGEPESWGTWSVGYESSIEVNVPARGINGTIRVGLQYRTIPFPGGAERLVQCVIGERTLHEWKFTAANSQGELAIEIPASSVAGPVELLLVNVNAKSPAELGLGPDQRRLGIGVEQIRLLS